MASTLNGTGITFSDGTTSASGSTFGAIGTVALLYWNGTTPTLPNTTVAGSTLIYPSTISSWPGSGSTVYTNGNGGTAANSYLSPQNYTSFYTRSAVGNTGFLTPLGSTAMSGTWRLITPVYTRTSNYYGCDNITVSNTPSCFAVRVS